MKGLFMNDFWDGEIPIWQLEEQKINVLKKMLKEMIGMIEESKFVEKQTCFNCCGQCRFAYAYSVKKGYEAIFACGFLKNAGVEGDENYFNAPCFLKKIKKKSLEKIRDGLREKIIKLSAIIKK